MSDALHLTIVYEQDPDSDWIVVSIPEVPGVLSQGRTREEAREMVLDALGGMLELRAAEHAVVAPVTAPARSGPRISLGAMAGGVNRVVELECLVAEPLRSRSRESLTAR